MADNKYTLDLSKFISIGGTILKVSGVFSGLFGLAIWMLSLYYHKEIAEYDRVVNWKHTMQDKTVPKLDTLIHRIETQNNSINHWITEKEKTFAIGLRVEAKTNDLFYKNKLGDLFRAYTIPGYEGYYYTDKNGTEHKCFNEYNY